MGWDAHFPNARHPAGTMRAPRRPRGPAPVVCAHAFPNAPVCISICAGGARVRAALLLPTVVESEVRAECDMHSRMRAPFDLCISE